MRLLWLAHDGNINGANLCLLEYLDILQQKGFHNHLIIPFVKGLALAAKEKNIPYTEIKYYGWAAPTVDYKHPLFLRFKKWARNQIAICKIKDLIRTVKPDFVITNTIVTPVAAFAARKVNTKHIWFVHEFGEEDHGFSIRGKFRRGAEVMNQLSYKIVFNSLAVREKYKGIVPESKQLIVSNAVVVVTTAQQNVDIGSEFKLIMLGQVAASKNHLEAFKALKRCKDKGLKFKLNIVGKAEIPTVLEELLSNVKAFKLQDQVKFLGPLSNPLAFLQQHNALLMCSKMEAFGRVTVEALKLGIPVIAANKGGSLEIIEDGINGYFYESKNEKDLADKIMLLHKEYKHFNKSEIAEKAREKFNEVNTYKQLLNVFC